jgi:tRNA threonylcarbamoyladenosine biosynthesis protein TsaB
MENTKSINSPLILSIETSGRLGSVALALGEKLFAEKQFTGPMRHSAEIFPDIVSLLEQFNKKPADIEQVYISIGPGSFTGLRIAVTIAKSMALANQVKIVAVDTLDCIASNVIRLTDLDRLAVILDAKRGQFFAAVYERINDLNWNKTLPDSLMTSNEFLERFSDKQIALVGEGLVYYRDNFKSPNIQILDEKYWNPSAANTHKLGLQKAIAGDFADPVSLTPNYIRAPDVKIKIEN